MFIPILLYNTSTYIASPVNSSFLRCFEFPLAFSWLDDGALPVVGLG